MPRKRVACLKVRLEMEAIESVLTIALICSLCVYGVAFVTMAVTYVLGGLRGLPLSDQSGMNLTFF